MIIRIDEGTYDHSISCSFIYSTNGIFFPAVHLIISTFQVTIILSFDDWNIVAEPRSVATMLENTQEVPLHHTIALWDDH